MKIFFAFLSSFLLFSLQCYEISESALSTESGLNSEFAKQQHINVLGLSKTQNLTLGEFFERAESNSSDLAQSRAKTTAIMHEGRAARAWESPYIDTQTQQVQSASGGKELESEIYFMLSPRLPWVRSALTQIYETRHLREVKNYELLKILNVIALKRLYLDYLLQQEALNIYIDRIQSAQESLNIAQERYDAGRISQAQYLFFKSDLLKVQAAMAEVKKQMLHTINALRVGLGIDENSDVRVLELKFEYTKLERDDVAKIAQDSLYLQIAGLDVQDYSQSAKHASRSRFDAVDIGVGGVVSPSNNGAGVKLKIPLPITSKFDNQKKMYMALESGALAQKEILSRKIGKNAQSYLEQLEAEEGAIDMAMTNEANAQKLYEIARVGYEAGRTSVFEYLSIKDQYLETAIMVVEDKRHYINTMSMLEETLAMVLIGGRVY